jgi:chromosome segregation ATPase
MAIPRERLLERRRSLALRRAYLTREIGRLRSFIKWALARGGDLREVVNWRQRLENLKYERNDVRNKIRQVDRALARASAEYYELEYFGSGGGW